MLIGKYYDYKAKFFYYTYSVGYGRHKITYSFTVLEIFFEKTEFPPILLQSKKGRGMMAQRHGQRDKDEIKIRLEEEFEKNYNLFAKDGYGVEVMQIFNKDFLRFLKAESSNFSIEFRGNRVYIYDDILIRKKEQLKEFFEVTSKLVEKTGPLLNRLDNDFAVLHKYYNQ